jgi:hypothetical protein
MPETTNKNRSIGLKRIDVGEVVATGGMPATMAPLGKTLRGTANFSTEADTVQDFFSEEQPIVPEESITSEAGLKNLVFNIMEWDNASLIDVFGGSQQEATVTIDGQTYTVMKYKAPSDTVTIEKAFRVITLYKQVIDIKRARVIARFVWNLSRTEIAQVEVTARVMAPPVTTDAPYEIYKLGTPATDQS